MSEIIVGSGSDSKSVKLDLDVLLRTRMLIQASSGNGKSWALRRLAEQMFGKIQVIIIDPEGEFGTLREKFDYVLVGKGGETPADCRSAALLAHKLLELKASAVCDLFEMKPLERHRWVKLFLDAMIDAPKELWHPAAVIVDEAHSYVPEKGDSEAADSMIALATRGRKRGFAAIFATQRLAKLRKDAAAELQNVMIGGTTIDIDRKRAADTLGIYGPDIHKFFDEVKLLKPGEFYALGRAISSDRVLMKVAGIETTHPEAGSIRHSLEPPPPSDKIKSWLPKLADLPKTSEHKAMTEKELRTEVLSLRAKLRSAESSKEKIYDPRLAERLQSLQEENRKLKADTVALRKSASKLHSTMSRFRSLVMGIPDELESAAVTMPSAPPVKAPAAIPAKHHVPTLVGGMRTRETILDPHGTSNGNLSGPHRKILTALVKLRAVGYDNPPRAMVAGWAGYSAKGGAFQNPLGSLRTMGLVDYPGPGSVSITEAGEASCPETVEVTSESVRSTILSTCTGPERKILAALLEWGPEGITRTDLAAKSGYEPTGGAFQNPLGALRTKGFLDYPAPGYVKAEDWLFAV